MKIPLNKQDQKTYCTCMILGLIVACIVFLLPEGRDFCGDEMQNFPHQVLIIITIGIFDFLIACFLCVVWIVDYDGIIKLGFFGHLKIKKYAWEDFHFIGAIEVLGFGRTPTEKMIVCAREIPRKLHGNSCGYQVASRGTVLIEYTPERYEEFLKFCGGTRCDVLK